MKLSRNCLVLCCAVLAIGTTVRRAEATPFVIDPGQSYLSLLVGFYDDSDPPEFVEITTAQVLGSDSTSLSGLLQASIIGGSIFFSSNPGQIAFANQSSPMQPDVGGTLPGSAPANYGLIIDFEGALTGPAAVRGATADLSAPSVPIIGNAFDSSALLISLDTAILDVNLTGFTTVVATSSIGGNSGLNTNPNGTVDIFGEIATLTIPIYVEAIVEVEVSEGFVLPLTAVFEGQIVAVGPVPEPSSFALLGAGAVALVATAVRRRRRR